LLLGAGHLLALAVVALLAFPLSIKLLLVLSLGLSLMAGLWSYTGSRAVASVMVSAEGHWSLIERGGRVRQGRLVGHYLGPRLVVLTFALGWRRRSLVMPMDSAPAEDLRRLRVRLRTAPTHSSG
ncbi:MAG: hypothetical protein R3310_06930, partial [Candidatus Competibacteraceae bacterium]|nr:hypothetical protein [Candidatus Competibacteraceae bacterium]